MSAADPMARPVPVADEGSAPFWAAAADGGLVLASCSACSAVAHPPEVVCPSCGSTDPAWRWSPVATTGVVRSWTVLRQPFLPGFAADLPIVLVDVAIDGTDDVRLIGRLLDPPPAALEPAAQTGEHAVLPPAASPDAGTSIDGTSIDGSTAPGAGQPPAGEADPGSTAHSPELRLRLGQTVAVDVERFGDGVSVPAFRLAAP